MSDLTITLIQTSLFWEDADANLKMFTKKINSISEKTEIVILPEMFTTGFSMKPEKLAEKMSGKSVEWMRNICAKKKIILTGSLIIKEQEKYYNRLIWMLPDGNYGVYDKRHLFAFSGEDGHYTAGNKKLIASVKGWKILLQVCYDLRFPVWSRQSVESLEQYDLMINVANWPLQRSVAWNTLLRARAIENQCFVAGVNTIGKDGNDQYYEGGSTIIDPLGSIIYQKNKEADIFTFTLEKQKIKRTRKQFPFWRDADSFLISR